MITPTMLEWIMTQIDLNQYSDIVTYNKEDIVTIRNTAYISVSDNNLGNDPLTSNQWFKLA